jgi:hypothetical protein
MPVYLFEMENQTIRSPHYACQRVLSNSKNFVKQLFLRQQMGLVQVHIDTFNELRRSVSSLQMIGMGIGGIIGQ